MSVCHLVGCSGKGVHDAHGIGTGEWKDYVKPKPEVVDHPQHYTQVVPGIECIDVVQHFSFVRGNAIKYLWRAGAKGDLVEDLRKAQWYIQREIDSLTKTQDG